MILARVLGNIVATQKNLRYENASVMLCQQITPEGDETAYTVIALNSVDAGDGRYRTDCSGGWSDSPRRQESQERHRFGDRSGDVDRIDLVVRTDDTNQESSSRDWTERIARRVSGGASS